MQHPARAIDVAAAQRDGAFGDAAEHREHLARLDAGAEHEIDDNIRGKRAKRGGRVDQVTTIADDFIDSCRHSSLPAMEDDNIMTGTLELEQTKGPMKPEPPISSVLIIGDLASWRLE
jgi:hypothetical protein